MIAYIKGTIVLIGMDYIIIDHQGIGYKILMSKTDQLQLNQEYQIYTYHYVREDAIQLFGFLSLEEHDLFLQLIGVKGVGPKTAQNMLASCTIDDMMIAIEQDDVAFMKKLPGIGAKTASQIVLDLKGKLIRQADTQVNNQIIEIEEAMEALKSLGYKANELVGVKEEMLALEESASTDQYIRIALTILAKRKGV